MLDLENPKSRKLFLWLYLDQRENFCQIGQKCLKNWVFLDFQKIWIQDTKFFFAKNLPLTNTEQNWSSCSGVYKQTYRQTNIILLCSIDTEKKHITYISKISMKPQSRSVQPFRSNCQKYDNMKVHILKLCPEYSSSIHLLIFAIKYRI